MGALNTFRNGTEKRRSTSIIAYLTCIMAGWGIQQNGSIAKVRTQTVHISKISYQI